MSIQRELETLIKEDVLIEIEEYIKELKTMIESNNDTIDANEELKQMEEMKKDFEDILTDLVHGDIKDEEAKELLDEIIEMRKEED
ncbi:hypothetical protein [Malaciobacter pacificus]|jgi:polyhydroxyalkanoate synthesis regulator phasin|uniref:Uncharacterized protein n=1 Tax=Malaciobacter pacificus TaxID=1080223 RepID=A0A5C2HCA2_9BACT|nr:hypothetical protein [Malaciobacter pacificus]QEP33912.1 hypothetical protein APAC_0769 [Malaciobacter pacificus]